MLLFTDDFLLFTDFCLGMIKVSMFSLLILNVAYYLSMFPKGCEISTEHLVWQWSAEGFIGEEGNRVMSLQKLGEDQLNDLVSRRLIEPVNTDADGKVLSFCVNIMVHDLVISMSEKENFVTINVREGNLVNRLSIQGNNLESRQTVS